MSNPATTTDFSKFRIGINMAGAVSAGAYTAGVLDFLVQALECWYAAKANHEAVPAHDVLIEALSGASAGGMCAAISATQLQETFTTITKQSPPPQVGNKLYNGWVRQIDIRELLQQNDLGDEDVQVESFLDCTVIKDIASKATVPGTGVSREWVSKNLSLFLTLTNLRGVSYRVDENANSTDEQMLYHADQMQFEVVRDNAQPLYSSALTLQYPPQSQDGPWEVLRTCAMATGAFPVMLAPRVLTRNVSDYMGKAFAVRTPVGKDAEGYDIERVTNTVINPVFPPDFHDTTLENVYVDGGMTNNNPFECARRFLARDVPDGHNPRDPEKADAAVLTIAPFPAHDIFNPNYQPAVMSALTNLIGPLISALVSQSRFQGEDLKLAADPDVASRFMIAPVDEPETNTYLDPPLQCGSFGAFGGFLAQEFRDRDYQLGRRNCQQFLRKHFLLPPENELIAKGMPQDKFQYALVLKNFGVERRDKEGHIATWLPIIPLCGEAAAEVPYPARAMPPDTVWSEIAGLALERVRAVLPRLLDRLELIPTAVKVGLALLGWKLRGEIEDALREGAMKPPKVTRRVAVASARAK
ncbi:MAG: hypothetical protein JOZ43_02820 [Acidobacteriales bacterium]|nr:hypothetical protein [Terriglobales bacterium]